MKKCVIYLRVSSQQQNFESQKADLIKYAGYKGYEITGTWGEKITGTDPDIERVEYNKMKDYVIDNSIDIILMWEISRLGRSTSETTKEIKYFKDNNVNIYFWKEQIYTISDNPTHKLVVDILASMAELEASTIKERMGRGRNLSITQGKRTGYCFLPYGFDADEDSMLIINPKEALIIQEIYDKYINGDSMRSIRISLNARNIPTRHTTLNKKNKYNDKVEWRNNSINNILNNSIYKGKREYKGQIIDIPQIIDTKKWDTVKDMRDRNIGYFRAVRTKYKSKVINRNYLFKSKILCGHCNYICQTRTETRYANQPSYYFCNSKDLPIKCKTGQFSSKMIDDILYVNVFNTVNSKIRQYFIDEHKLATGTDDMKKQIINLNFHIKEIKAEMEKNNDMYKHNYITPVKYHSEQAEKAREITATENNIRQLERDIINFDQVDINTVITKAKYNKDFETQFEYTQKYVDKVVIYRVNEYNRDAFLKNSIVWKNATKIRMNDSYDKLVYIEMFAFGTNNPLKIILSSWSKRYIFGKQNIQYNLENESLSISDAGITFNYR
jgi:site-specific DNA recombinase